MKRLVTALVFAGMCASGAAFAQTAPAKPAAPASEKTTKSKAAKGDSGMTYTATCKDGTTYTGKTKKHACAKHGGVKSWDSK